MEKDWPEVFTGVHSALMRRGCSLQDAQDFAHEAWLRLAQYERTHHVDDPEAFLMRVAINLAIDAQRFNALHEEEPRVESSEIPVPVEPSPEDLMLARQQAERAEKAIRKLSLRVRLVYLAHYEEGLTYQQIADRFLMSLSTVEKHMARAIKLLTKAKLRGWW